MSAPGSELAVHGSKELARQDWLDKIELLKETVALGATPAELDLFLHTAEKRGLDPLARQIYFVKRQGKGTIQVGIDGLRAIAHRTGRCAGITDAKIVDGSPYPLAASVTVYRMVEGQKCEFTATARWDEYYPGDAQGFQWKRMPHVMLAKCAEALALRKAFPEDLSGLYENSEMDQAGNADAIVAEAVDLSHTVTPEEKKAASVEAAPEAKMGRDGQPLERIAFGYRAVRWPIAKMCGEPPTESQVNIMRSKALDRHVDAESIDPLRAVVLSKYGVDKPDTKGGYSLYVDWLINASDDSILNGIAALDAPKEGEIVG